MRDLVLGTTLVVLIARLATGARSLMEHYEDAGRINFRGFDFTRQGYTAS
jgi:hypothetical protein